MKMNITFCVSSMPNHRMVSGISAATGRLRPKQRERRARRFDDAPRSGDDAERHADEDRETEADQHALQRRGDALQQRTLVQQAGKAGEHLAAGSAG